jgi:hypothetical protein
MSRDVLVTFAGTLGILGAATAIEAAERERGRRFAFVGDGPMKGPGVSSRDRGLANVHFHEQRA